LLLVRQAPRRDDGIAGAGLSARDPLPIVRRSRLAEAGATWEIGMSRKHRIDHQRLIVPPGRKVRLKDYDPAGTGEFENKGQAQEALAEDVSALAAAQELLWASAQYSVLIIFQGLDAAGKDGTIKHVMSGVNPQGCAVYSFKAPTDEERLHHFLWRPGRYLPARGRIAIFNRSYYEEVLVVRVHPEWLAQQWLPAEQRKTKNRARLWATRYDEINNFEGVLTRGGNCVIKFFLHVSRKEQRRRFLERLTDPDKYWKFSAGDFRERQFWDAYTEAYEDMLSATSTPAAPWYVIPADHKWFMRAAVADIIATRIRALDLNLPGVTAEKRRELTQVRRALQAETRT
jgi:PPK2 family polyphosphate:nucleotide phosphotransferase